MRKISGRIDLLESGRGKDGVILTTFPNRDGMRGLARVKTIVVQIGNSDNKLPQAQWAEFVRRVDETIREHAQAVHFFGGTENWAAWQRVCWVFDCEETRMSDLRSRLTAARKEFRQDAAAFTEGETEFI